MNIYAFCGYKTKTILTTLDRGNTNNIFVCKYKVFFIPFLQFYYFIKIVVKE